MAQAAEIHILVVRSAICSGPDPVDVLERLGAEIRVEVLADLDACLERCRRGAIDLIVTENGSEFDSMRLLEALRRGGPPVVVVNRAEDEAAALEAFRHGAADCVNAGPELARVLPTVALEQIHRWRSNRAQDAAERRIRDLERYSENIIQNLNSALLVVDTEGKIVVCNPPAEEVLGEDAAALRGRPVWEWFPGIPREEIPVARTLGAGESFKGIESVVIRRDGTRVPIGISCAPLSDAEGGKLGAVAVFSDLTEIKQLQRQVFQSEKMASIGQLAAGVAHEINNPMGFIHANLFQLAEYISDLRGVWDSVDALQHSIATGEMDAIRESSQELSAVAEKVDVVFLLADFVKAIRESQEGSERIRHIVDDLREFSHRDAEQPVLADVNRCLDSTASIVWPMMKHIVVLEKQYRDLPQISCYPMQLKQVFINLLVNGYQAIEERVGDAGETGHIWLRTDVREDCVVISVTDTGVGIPPENLDRIFDPFFTTKKVGSGTGLGLSTCFNIIERHGGRIEVESTPGVETTFSVLLPNTNSGGERDGE